MGKALLLAAEEDSWVLGRRGIVAWGLVIPIWMPSFLLKKQGYKAADRIAPSFEKVRDLIGKQVRKLPSAGGAG
jgi:hypothetical protein